MGQSGFGHLEIYCYRSGRFPLAVSFLGHDEQYPALFLAVPAFAIENGDATFHLDSHFVGDVVALVRNDDELYALSCSVYGEIQNVGRSVA